MLMRCMLMRCMLMRCMLMRCMPWRLQERLLSSAQRPPWMEKDDMIKTSTLIQPQMKGIQVDTV